MALDGHFHYDGANINDDLRNLYFLSIFFDLSKEKKNRDIGAPVKIIKHSSQ